MSARSPRAGVVWALGAILLTTASSAAAQTPRVPSSPGQVSGTTVAPGQNGAAIHGLDNRVGRSVEPGSSTNTVGPIPPTAAPTPTASSASAPAGSNATGDVANSEMLIGAGDLLEVSVYGAPDYIKQVRVSAAGEVTLPLAGTVKVGGMTPVQAETLIAKRLSSGGFFNDPRVSVLEKEFATQGISVLGEVQKPGIYPLPGPRSLFDVLSAAGGTTARAGNTVTVTHRSAPQEQQTIKLANDGSKQNVPVYPGDTVVVSKAGVVYVVGDVRLPGGFIMENAHMTILQAVAMAQGANPTAALDKTRLIRNSGSSSEPAEVQVSLKKILGAKQPDISLQPNDIVFIPNSAAKTAGRRTVDAIIQVATGMAIYGR